VHGRRWATTERTTFLRDGLKTLFVVAAARSTFDDDGVVPLYEDEATYLFSQVAFRASLYLISIGTRVDVTVITGDSYQLTDVSAEFFGAVAVKAGEIEGRSQVKPFTIDLCTRLVEARIIVHEPSLLDYTHILGLLLYDCFDSHGLVSEMESFFPVQNTREARRASNSGQVFTSNFPRNALSDPATVIAEFETLSGAKYRTETLIEGRPWIKKSRFQKAT
jgi:hypothetical protein